MQQIHPNALLLTREEAARWLAMSTAALSELCKREAIRYTRRGGRLFFRPADLQAWVDAQFNTK